MLEREPSRSCRGEGFSKKKAGIVTSEQHQHQEHVDDQARDYRKLQFACI